MLFVFYTTKLFLKIVWCMRTIRIKHGTYFSHVFKIFLVIRNKKISMKQALTTINIIFKNEITMNNIKLKV